MPVTPSPPAPLLGRATPAQPLSAGGAAEPSAVAGGAAGASSVAGGAVTESSAVPGAPAGSSSVAGVLEDASGSSPAVGGDRDAATTGSPFGSSGVTASFFDESGGRSSYVAGNGRYVDGPPNPEDIPFTRRFQFPIIHQSPTPAFRSIILRGTPVLPPVVKIYVLSSTSDYVPHFFLNFQKSRGHLFAEFLHPAVRRRCFSTKSE